jgi:hypothetical protein
MSLFSSVPSDQNILYFLLVYIYLAHDA